MQQLCLFRDCRKCSNCSSVSFQEQQEVYRKQSEALKARMEERIRSALGKFYERVRTGQYVSPEQKKQGLKRHRF